MAGESQPTTGAPRASASGLFIAGTDTGVGKTLAAVSIVRSLARRGLRVAAMKPIAAGAASTPHGRRNDDAAALAAAANVQAPYDTLNPYCLLAPVSPHIAAAEESVVIDTALIASRFRELAARADCVIVEGAGGWLAPISGHETLADVAQALGLPVVLVVGLRLGCLNHALLSARAIEGSGLALAGWIGSHVDPAFERLEENVATLTARLARPPIAIIPHRACAAGPLELEPGVVLSTAESDALAALVRAGAAAQRAWRT